MTHCPTCCTSFNYGNVHYVMLNSEGYMGLSAQKVTPDSEMYKWLKQVGLRLGWGSGAFRAMSPLQRSQPRRPDPLGPG